MKDIADYQKYESTLVSRVFPVALIKEFFSGPLTYIRDVIPEPTNITKISSPTTIRLFEKVSEKADRDNPFFKIITAKRKEAALADYLLRNHPRVNFSAVLETFEIEGGWVQSIRRFRTLVIGAIFAFGAFLVNSVPRALLEEFSITNDQYEIWVFLLMCIIFFGGVSTLIPIWLLERRKSVQAAFIRRVLRYAEISRNSAI